MTNKEFAEKLIKEINKHGESVVASGPVGQGYAMAHKHIIDVIEQQLKFAMIEEKLTGSWIAKKVDASHYHYYCSNCNFRSKYFKSRYCPECGKKMKI